MADKIADLAASREKELAPAVALENAIQEPSKSDAVATTNDVVQAQDTIHVAADQAAHHATTIITPASASVPNEETSPVKTEESPAAPIASTPLEKLLAELPSIIAAAEHSEMWGVNLRDATHVPTTIVLEKFLRANVIGGARDVTAAKAQLTEALRWRKKMEASRLVDAVYDKARFGGLGYVATYAGPQGKEIVTFNIYGAVKDKKATFGNIEEFIKWRSALMELAVRELDLASATVAIPPNGPDPYRMLQVHDYLSISFLRQDPSVKAASKESITTFSMAYPELMREKFFVNVPVIMGWMFAAMKLVLSADTVRKFHPLSYGAALAGELPGFGAQLPVVYGGEGPTLEESAMTTRFSDAEVKGKENEPFTPPPPAVASTAIVNEDISA